LPVKGIRVSVDDRLQYEFTDTDGKFSLYTEASDSYKIKCEDVDASQNGSFYDKDTFLTVIVNKVYLNIALQEK
jgi:hypothetical protein